MGGQTLQAWHQLAALEYLDSTSSPLLAGHLRYLPDPPAGLSDSPSPVNIREFFGADGSSQGLQLNMHGQLHLVFRRVRNRDTWPVSNDSEANGSLAHHATTSQPIVAG